MAFFISATDWDILRTQVRAYLLAVLNSLKHIGIIVSIIVAPWIPAYVVKITINDQNKEELAQYISKSLGSLSGYMDSLFTLEQLCEEYKTSSPEERITNNFFQRFDTYMAQSIDWRARLSADAEETIWYLGADTTKMIDQVMIENSMYGLTADKYCSYPHWELKTITTKEREIRRLIAKKIQQKLNQQKTNTFNNDVGFYMN